MYKVDSYRNRIIKINRMNVFSITTLFAEVRVEYNGTEEQPRMAVEELLWNPELSGVENFLHVSTVGGAACHVRW